MAYAVTAGSYQQIIIELVSHGYVVISPSHPSIADNVIFDDGSKHFIKAQRDKTLFETEYKDTEFLLNNISSILKDVKSADINKLGIIGHSLGAFTAIKSARLNPLIKAGISLDPPISHTTYEYTDDLKILSKLDDTIPLDNGSNLDIPFLHIFAEKSMCDSSSLSLSENNFKAIIKNTEHNSFADHSILKEKVEIFQQNGWNLGAGDSPSSSYIEELNLSIRSFFDKYLSAEVIDLADL